MHTAMEMAAVKASFQAYLTSMIQGYNTKLVELEAYHIRVGAETRKSCDQAIAKLKDDVNKERASAKETQDLAIDQAVRKATEGASGQVKSISINRDQLLQSGLKLQSELNETKKEKTQAITAASQESARLRNDIAEIQQTHRQEIMQLQKQLEDGSNTWIEIHFIGKNGYVRTVVHRPSTTFLVATATLCIMKKLRVFKEIAWEHNGVIIEDGAKTLAQVSTLILRDFHRPLKLRQLGIKTGDEITYSKR